MPRSNFLLYLAASIVPRVSMFAVLFVLARLVPALETGLFVLVVTAGEIGDSVLQYWCRTLFMRKQAASSRARRLQAGRLAALSTAGLGIGLAGSAAAAAAIAPGHEAGFALALGAYLVSYGALRTALVVIQARHAHAAYCRVEILRGVLVPVGALGPVWLGLPVLPWAGLGVAASAAIPAIVAIVVATRLVGRPRLPATGYRLALRFGLPIIGASLAGQMFGWGDRLVLNEWLGPAAVAAYGLTYALARQPIELLAAPLNSSSFPMLFRTYASEKSEGLARIVGAMIVTHFALAGAAAVFISIMRVPIAEALLPVSYRETAHMLLPPLAVAGVVMAIKSFNFENVFAVTNRNGDQFVSLLLSGVLALAATIVLVARFGIAGSGIASLVSALLGLTMVMLFSRRILAVPLNWLRLGQACAAMAAAGLAAALTDVELAGVNVWLRLVAAAGVFGIVYAPLLMLSGFRLTALLSAPWEVIGVPSQDVPVTAKAATP